MSPSDHQTGDPPPPKPGDLSGCASGMLALLGLALLLPGGCVAYFFGPALLKPQVHGPDVILLAILGPAACILGIWLIIRATRPR